MIHNPYLDTPTTNKHLVDRMLGIAYERVKQVVANLDKLEYFSEHLTNIDNSKESVDTLTEALNKFSLPDSFSGNSLGMIGHDEDSSEVTVQGDNFIYELNKALPYFEPLAQNIDSLTKAGIYIKDIIALALNLDVLKTIYANQDNLDKLADRLPSIDITAQNLDSINRLVNYLSSVVDLAKELDSIDTITSHLDHLKTISENIHQLVTVSNGIEDIQRAISYYSTFKEVLDNAELIKVLKENKETIQYINEHKSALTALMANHTELTNLLKYIDNFTLLALHIEDIHRVLDNIDLIKEYSDMSDKITSLYSALYPTAKTSEIYAESSDDLQDVINNAPSGSTIFLTKNTRANLVIPSGKRLTFNLNGHSIENADGKDTLYIELGASVSILGSGTISNTSKSVAPVFNNGSCVIENTTILKTGEEYYGILNHGQMVLGNGVNVILPLQATSSCVVNGYYDYTSNNERLGHVANKNLAYPTLVINNGTYTGGRNTIKNDDGGLCSIFNGTFINNFNLEPQSLGAALFNVNNLIVYYAKVEAKNTIAIYNRYYNNTVDIGSVTVNAGSFEGKVINHNNNGSIKIIGGTFDTDVSAYMQEGE